MQCIEKPEGLVITIEDNGVGIAQEYKERIFEKDFGKSTGNSHSLFLAREILSITGITIRETAGREKVPVLRYWCRKERTGLMYLPRKSR